MQPEAPGAGRSVAVNLGQEPEEQSCDDEDDEDDGYGIDDELAGEAEERSAVELP